MLLLQLLPKLELIIVSKGNMFTESWRFLDIPICLPVIVSFNSVHVLCDPDLVTS